MPPVAISGAFCYICVIREDTMTLEDVLKLLARSEDDFLEKYTPLVESALTDDYPSTTIIRGQHRVTVRRKHDGTCHGYGSYTWRFTAYVDMAEVEISVTVYTGKNGIPGSYKIEVETTKIKRHDPYRAVYDSEKSGECSVIELLFNVAKQMPVKSTKKFEVPEYKRKNVMGALNNLFRTLKETKTRLVRLGDDKLAIVPKTVITQDTDFQEDYDFVDIDFYEPVKTPEIIELGWGTAYAMKKRKR